MDENKIKKDIVIGLVGPGTLFGWRQKLPVKNRFSSVWSLDSGQNRTLGNLRTLNIKFYTQPNGFSTPIDAHPHIFLSILLSLFFSAYIYIYIYII